MSRGRRARPNESDDAGVGEVDDAGQRQAQQVGGRVRNTARRVGGHQVPLLHDGRDDRGLGRAEEERHGGDQEGHHVDQAHVDLDGQRHRHQQSGTHHVTGDHRDPAVPSVYQGAGQVAQEHAGDGSGGEGEPHLQRRAGAVQDQESERHGMDPLAG